MFTSTSSPPPASASTSTSVSEPALTPAAASPESGVPYLNIRAIASTARSSSGKFSK